MQTTVPAPAGLNPEVFLRDYWQQKPCLFRQALSDFTDLIAKESLFSLCQDEHVQSRLVLEKDGDYPWQVITAPLQEADISALPDSHWTVLVQNMEMHSTAVFDLLQHFHFLPGWRIDDIMISYASHQGSVGPHLDSYDVFLLQTSGKRRWAISHVDDKEENFIEGLDLRILADFHAEQEWLLQPGDMLYLPPGIAHHGIAEGEGITCSIGFRAPQQYELLGAYLDEQCLNLQARYTDAPLSAQHTPYRLQQQDLDSLQGFMLAQLNKKNALQHWLGRYLTRLPDGIDDLSEAADSLTPGKQTAVKISRNLKSRMLYRLTDEQIELYINGDCIYAAYELEPLIQLLCQNRELLLVDIAALLKTHQAQALVAELTAMNLIQWT